MLFSIKKQLRNIFEITKKAPGKPRAFLLIDSN